MIRNEYSTGFELMKVVVERKGHYYVSNNTLHEIKHGATLSDIDLPPCQKEFEKFLKSCNLTVEKISQGFSVIKK